MIYVNYIPEAVKSKLFLYGDDSLLMYQHKDIATIEKILTEDFENIYDWFVDYKLSIYFRDDKTKSILFVSKRGLKIFVKIYKIQRNKYKTASTSNIS